MKILFLTFLVFNFLSCAKSNRIRKSSSSNTNFKSVRSLNSSESEWIKSLCYNLGQSVTDVRDSLKYFFSLDKTSCSGDVNKLNLLSTTLKNSGNQYEFSHSSSEEWVKDAFYPYLITDQTVDFDFFCKEIALLNKKLENTVMLEGTAVQFDVKSSVNEITAELNYFSIEKNEGAKKNFRQKITIEVITEAKANKEKWPKGTVLFFKRQTPCSDDRSLLIREHRLLSIEE